jgi:glycosyltransferase involved in cell wall biosynthesis
MNDTTEPVDVSLIVPVGRRQADPAELFAEYRAGLDALGGHCEMIFVLDGPNEKFAAGLKELAAGPQRVTIVSLTRAFGEATAIMAGFEQAKGQVIVTLPAYFQVEATELPKLVGSLDKCDLAIARRWPRAGGIFERMRRGAFHGLLATVTGLRFDDLGCGARAFDRRVLEEIQLYGDQHKFLPVLADRKGFKVSEIDVRQSPKDRHQGFYEPRVYARGLLDIFTIFFLVRFTKKPLRFFGMIGVTLFAIGALVVTWLVAERLFLGHGLTERPALLLSSLLVVLGLQLIALGLLGELIIFTHARQVRDYQIDSVLSFRQGQLQASRRSGT